RPRRRRGTPGLLPGDHRRRRAQLLSLGRGRGAAALHAALPGLPQGELSVTARLPLRAPRQDGAVVAEPPLADVGAMPAANAARLAAGGALLGRPWAEL